MLEKDSFDKVLRFLGLVHLIEVVLVGVFLMFSTGIRLWTVISEDINHLQQKPTTIATPTPTPAPTTKRRDEKCGRKSAKNKEISTLISRSSMFDAISVLLSGFGLVQNAASGSVQRQMLETLENIRDLLMRQSASSDLSISSVPQPFVACMAECIAQSHHSRHHWLTLRPQALIRIDVQ